MNPYPDGAALVGGLMLGAITGQLLFRYLHVSYLARVGAYTGTLLLLWLPAFIAIDGFTVAYVMGSFVGIAAGSRLDFVFNSTPVARAQPPAPPRKPTRSDRSPHLGFCPRCGKDLIEKSPRDGKVILGCSGSTCGYARSVNR